MAHFHLEHKAQVNPQPGIFPLYVKVDFKKDPLGSGDYHVLAKTLINWVILDSFWKMPTASTSATVLDIGFDYDGSGHDVLDGGDASGANTTWTQGAYLSGALKIETVDSYLTVEAETAAISDGILEILLLVAAGVDESAPADNVAVSA
jgi:hypothetical protein